MTGLCLRCGRREREVGLLMCRACLEGLLGRPAAPAPWRPEWRKRDLARDETGAAFREAA